MSEEVTARVGADGKKTRYRASLVTKVLGDLNQESAAKSTYVVGILTLDSAIDPDKLQAAMIERLMVIPRFRSKYVWKTFGPYFESINEEDMDWDYHFKVAFAGEKPTFKEVTDYLSNEMKDPTLDHDKPLWRFTFVPEMDDGRGVMITNISHTLGDGISQTEVLFRILDEGADEGKIVPRPKGKRKKKSVSTLTAAGIFVSGVFAGVFSVFGRPDPANSLKIKGTSKVSFEKRQAFCERIPLDKCREIKNKIEGATLNDVFMVLLTMLLRHYYDETGEKIKSISASFPVNLRKSAKENFDKHGSPHNIWAYGLMSFSLNYKDPLDLFRKLKKTLDRVKLSPTPIVQQKIASVVTPCLPLKARNGLVLNLANKCTAQLSNVPGPSNKVFIAGYGVDDLTFQLFSPVGLYLGLITYNGMLSCSINADGSVAPPEELAKHWMPAFDELYDFIVGSRDDTIISL